MSTGASHEVTELGGSTPKEEKVKELVSGDVGYVCASIKKISDVKIGDTITLDDNPAKEVLPGYKEIKPMVYSGIYPVETNKYNDETIKNNLKSKIINKYNDNLDEKNKIRSK